MVIKRRQTRRVMVGNLPVGGGTPITVQSMTTSKTGDLDSLLPEISRLEEAGCQIIRVTVPDEPSAAALNVIRAHTSVPLVADIHFNYRIALKAIDAGIDKIRINPGNIGDRHRVATVLKAAKESGIPIRIGINSGSLEKQLLEKYGFPTAEAMMESAERHIRICEEEGFDNIIVSMKSSDVPLMLAANRLFASRFDYPLHLGVTEAGPLRSGTIRSSVGIGTLLSEGIGDTIRVSLTGDPADEVRVGYEILKSLGLPSRGVTIISCPTCGRLEVDLISIVEQLEAHLEKSTKTLKVAVMGCAVNGPGEAMDADIGVACGKKSALLFRNGKIIEKISEADIVPRLLTEIDRWKS